MRIVHCADLHYGYRQYGFAAREEDFYKAGDYVFSQLRNVKADCVIIAGDAFDMPKPPARAVHRLRYQIEQLAKADGGVDVYAIDGNHDSCEGNWLEVCGAEVLQPDTPVMQEDVKIVGISYQRPTAFHQTIDELIKKGENIDVLVIHQALGEFADFEAQEITAKELGSKLGKIGVRVVIMGDIHGYQETVINDVRFIYSGSTELNSTDEKRDKSFSVIDIDSNTVKTEIHTIPTRPVVDYELNDEKALSTLMDELQKPDYDPLLFVYYESENRDLMKRAEGPLRDKHTLFRACPISKKGDKEMRKRLAKQAFDRNSAMNQLQAAVEAYFDNGTDEYELVFQMLNAPGDIEQVATSYLKSKNISI